MEKYSELFDSLKKTLSRHNFTESVKEFEDENQIVGITKTHFTLLNGLFGGRGLCALVRVPNEIKEQNGLISFFAEVRKWLNSKFVSFPWFKSMHSFLILVCQHDLFEKSRGIENRLKDKTGLHMNLIQGVILIDSETFDVISDYTRPAQHKVEFMSILETVTKWLKGQSV